jgi:phosphate:Na+ symporter
MTDGIDYWQLLAGLGIFLFGMYLLEDAIKGIAGQGFKTFLRRFTNTRLKAIASGALATGILQSSSAVSLMVLAFAGAGLMAMENAIGVILGSNIGTTITSWIVATLGFKLDIESFARPFIAIGGLGLIFLGKKESYAAFSKLLLGFGLLFSGLGEMKDSADAFITTFNISDLPQMGALTYFLAGLALTAIMQSSSAGMAIVLTTLNAGLVGLETASIMVIGVNIGTTITILLGSIGGTPLKKRVAFSHFAFNLVTGILAALTIVPLVKFASYIANGEALIALAMFHTLFNLAGVLVFIPLIGILSRSLYKIFPDRKAAYTVYIQNAPVEITDAAIEAIKQESRHLIQESLRFGIRATELPEDEFTWDEELPSWLRRPADIDDYYMMLGKIETAIFAFAARVQEYSVNEQHAQSIYEMLSVNRACLLAARFIYDIYEDFRQLNTPDNEFSRDQYRYLKERLLPIFSAIHQLLTENEHPPERFGRQINGLAKESFKQDHLFIAQITKAVNNGELSSEAAPVLMMVNRALVMSVKQFMNALETFMYEKHRLAQHS